MKGRRYTISREEPGSGMLRWVGYAVTIRQARDLAYTQPVVHVTMRDGSERHSPIVIVPNFGARRGEIIERV